jgi:hypothetical protein
MHLALTILGGFVAAVVGLADVWAQPAQGDIVDCASLNIALPDAPVDAVEITSFGAKPDDDEDDTQALQTAFDALKPSQTLVFAPGRYLHRKSLRITVKGTTLLGPGATLHATNPDDQSLGISADGVSLYGLTLTAATEGRKSGNSHHRIRVIGLAIEGSTRISPVFDTLIAHTRIQPPDGASGKTANSSSGAGIFLYRARRFVIANNLISRTLADGIHMTAGTGDGVVVGNTVRQTGDDMIAVVSYLRPGPTTSLGSASELSARYDSLAATGLAHNILIARNDVSGNYWGRGISVVGGANVTLRDNFIHDVPIGAGAGILLAREQGYFTFGVENVLIEGNRLQNIHVTQPSYTVKASASASQHGAIELHSFVFQDEGNDALLSDRLAVRRVLIRNNQISGVRTPGVRAGVRGNGLEALKGSARTSARRFSSGAVKQIGLVDNQFRDVPKGAITLLPSGSDPATMHCTGNSLNGKRFNTDRCDGALPAVVGASLSCQAPGRVVS